MPSLGNVGASALVKSAAGIATQIADYKDKMASLQWNSSAQTEADYATYSQYLDGRIKTLSSSGSLSTASKALTLTGTLQSANRSYVSNSIQRTSQAILEGNGTPTDKQNALIGFYKQAISNGDENLAQNIRSQYDTLNQQIQYQQQVATTAQAALDKANASAQAAGYSDAASMYEGVLKQLGQVIGAGGQGNLTKDLKQFVTNNAASFKALGVTLPAGSAPTDGALIQGIMSASAAANYKASQATAVTDPIASSNYLQTAQGILDGTKQFTIGGSSMNFNDATAFAQNPSTFFIKTTGIDASGKPTYGFAPTAVTGYQYDQQGNIQPIYATNDQTTYDALNTNDQKQTVTDLQAAGFTVKIVNGQVQATQSTDGKNAFFNNAIGNYGFPKDAAFIVNKTGTGYQFAPVNDSSTAPHLLTLSKDNTGKFGIYEQNFNPVNKSQSYNLIGQFDGFNAVQNTVTQSADRASSLAGALQQKFGTGTPLTNDYINSTIPDLAKQYFNGNNDLAKSAVTSFVQPIQYNTANPKSVPAAGIVPKNAANQSIAQNTAQILGIPMIGPVNNSTPAAAPKVSAPAPVKTPAAPPSIAGNGMISIPNGSKPDLNTALKSAFTNFSGQPQGYTENVVLKNIANSYFGGDIKAASTPVYQYRQTNFGQ
jgi:hypothetical protein